MSEIDLLIAECEKSIEKYGADDGVISAYCGISQMASNEKQIEKMLQCTKRSKELIANDCLNKTGLSMWEIDKFTYQHKTIFEPLDQYYDMLKRKTSVLTAICCIWNETENQKRGFMHQKDHNFRNLD